MGLVFDLDYRQLLDTINIGSGVYAPLNGFMGLAEIEAVIETGELLDGSPFGVPVVLPIHDHNRSILKHQSELLLEYNGQVVAKLLDIQVFEWRPESMLQCLFDTRDRSHPGVAMWASMPQLFVSGEVELDSIGGLQEAFSITAPSEIKELIRQRGWKTVVGFQTRNIPHRAHEYLLRRALETFDALLIQPMTGPRRSGDFAGEAIERAYHTLIQDYLPSSRVLFSPLRASMIFAGPREALLHAVMRRNFGCTHFLVGRDHAGVGGFYGEYEAQAFLRRFQDKLDIKIVEARGPYFCVKCGEVVSDLSCGHSKDKYSSVREVSGTRVRRMARGDESVETWMIREDVLRSAMDGKVFEE